MNTDDRPAPVSQPGRRWPVFGIGCLGLLVALILGVSVWVWVDSGRGWTVSRLKASIAAEVPLGVDRGFVAAWFERHKIGHEYTTDLRGARLGDSTMPMLAGLNEDDLEGMESGELYGKDANLGILSSGWIHIYFFFDKHGRLVGHLVEPCVFCL